VASAPGAIILWQDVHTGTVTVTAGFSLMIDSFERIRIVVFVLLICAMFFVFFYVYAHGGPSPSIWIQMGDDKDNSVIYGKSC